MKRVCACSYKQMQTFVARVEIRVRGLVHGAAADALEEIQSVGDRCGDALVGFLQRRVIDEAQIPVFGMMQIREAAGDQGANEIQCQRRTLIAAQQQFGIGRARLGRELRPVDEIAAVAGQA